MALVIVNNISDRTNPQGGPRAVEIGAVKIWPGRNAQVDSSALTPTVLELEGTHLAFGHLPASFLAKPAASVVPMTEDELRTHLEKLPLSQLCVLADGVSPPLAKRASAPRMVHSLLRAYRDISSLDPAVFFFTRNWIRQGVDTYIPVE